METNVEELIFYISQWVAIAGIALRFLLFWLVVRGLIDPGRGWFSFAKTLCWAMVICPVAMRWHFSHYAILYFAISMVVIGICLRLRRD